MATMAVDSRQQLGGMSYDHMRYQPPQFTNPWTAVSAAPGGQMYATSMAQHMPADQSHQQSMSMGPSSTTTTMGYPTASMPALAMPQGQQSMVDSPLFMGRQDSHVQDYSRQYHGGYSIPTTSTGYPASNGIPAPYAAPGYMPVDQAKLAPYLKAEERRSSHPLVASNNTYLDQSLDAYKYRQSSLIDMQNRLQTATDAERASFSDALDASRGLAAMSQDITPRNIYGNQGSARTSTDSYGFPSSHSAHSSISSASTYPSYYGSSVSEASYGDYSSASESVDVPSRRLPRPRSLVGGPGGPPAPQSMMGQFNSKISPSSQKKHKCKVCDKRFTRPSSLQTHMFSHTGEKPFACKVEGCGRHFSVVSNLRRHHKVHKGETDHTSPEDDDE